MNNVKIGWAKREISMEGPLSLPGQMYLRISTGVMDPTYATALCVDGGEGQDAVIFCACDREGFYRDVVQQVQDRAKAMRPELPSDAIIMNCTHTHAGAEINDTPETSPDGKPIYPGAKYREFFIQQCADAICEAWDTRKEGGIAFGYGYAVVGHSRRVIYSVDEYTNNVSMSAPNGYGVMYGKTNKPIFSHYEAGADHFVNLLYTFDANEKLTGMICNVPCPSQLSEHFCQMTADFWHDVRTLVQKEYGEDVYVLPQCAAAGDLSPRILHYGKAQARRMALKYGMEYDPSKGNDYNKVMSERYDIAERIKLAIDEVLSWAKKDIRTQLPVHHSRKIVELNRRMITEAERDWCQGNLDKLKKQLEEKLTEAAGDPDKVRLAVSNYEIVRNKNLAGIKRFETQHEDPTMSYPIHVASIGEAAFASNPFELYMDYMHRMQARSPYLQTFVIQLAGANNAGYLATERGMYNKGYSASLFCNRISAEGGQQLVDATLETLAELKAKDE